MFKRIAAPILSFAIVVGTAGVASAKDITTTPPAGFKAVSTLVKLPHFIPTYGTLYVDPKTLPAGPFLGYDHGGKLVNVIYMVPLKDLQAHKDWANAGTAAAGLKVDHTDIEFNPGHPGVDEPHYHFINWLVPHQKHQKDLAK
jgi:hypothetical protein